MKKSIFCVLFLSIFSIGYVFLYFSDSKKNDNNSDLPIVGNSFSRVSGTDLSASKELKEFPSAVPAKKLYVKPAFS